MASLGQVGNLPQNRAVGHVVLPPTLPFLHPDFWELLTANHHKISKNRFGLANIHQKCCDETHDVNHNKHWCQGLMCVQA